MPSTVKLEVKGLKETRAAILKAGGSLDDLEKIHRQAAEIIQQDAIRRAPRRTGNLRSHIEVEASASASKVIGGGGLVYFPIVHFGWSTRNVAKGLTRKEAQAKFFGSLSRRAINKSVAGQKTRVSRRGGQVVATRGKIRGGPIKPNPFLYLAVDYKVDEVFQRFEQQADDIARAFADG